MEYSAAVTTLAMSGGQERCPNHGVLTYGGRSSASMLALWKHRVVAHHAACYVFWVMYMGHHVRGAVQQHHTMQPAGSVWQQRTMEHAGSAGLQHIMQHAGSAGSASQQHTVQCHGKSGQQHIIQHARSLFAQRAGQQNNMHYIGIAGQQTVQHGESLMVVHTRTLQFAGGGPASSTPCSLTGWTGLCVWKSQCSSNIVCITSLAAQPPPAKRIRRGQHAHTLPVLATNSRKGKDDRETGRGKGHKGRKVKRETPRANKPGHADMHVVHKEKAALKLFLAAPGEGLLELQPGQLGQTPAPRIAGAPRQFDRQDDCLQAALRPA
eukprot:358829-Chlamydomonas_euryale.AAC.5